jgi:hypothetical protein
MTYLTVDPKYLKELAKKQDRASAKAGSAAEATSEASKWVWWTHGVISGASNAGVANAEAARRAAGEAMEKTAAHLGLTLRKAAEAYEGTDQDAAENLDKQVLAR